MHQIEIEAGPLTWGFELENELALKVLPSVKGLHGGLSGVIPVWSARRASI